MSGVVLPMPFAPLGQSLAMQMSGRPAMNFQTTQYPNNYHSGFVPHSGYEHNPPVGVHDHVGSNGRLHTGYGIPYEPPPAYEPPLPVHLPDPTIFTRDFRHEDPLDNGLGFRPEPFTPLNHIDPVTDFRDADRFTTKSFLDFRPLPEPVKFEIPLPFRFDPLDNSFANDRFDRFNSRFDNDRY